MSVPKPTNVNDLGAVLRAIAAASGLHENIAGDTSVDYHEQDNRKIILPGNPSQMSLTEAAARLTALDAFNDQTFQIREQIPGMPLDAAHAFVQVLRERYGWAETKSSTKQGFFGPIKEAPEMHRVITGSGPNDYIEVPVGDFKLPDISTEISTGFERSNANRSVAAYFVKANVRHKDRELIMGLISKAKEYLEKNSIYRGKAMRLRVDENGVVNYLFEPEFIDVMSVDETCLVHPRATEVLLESGLFTLIRKAEMCRKHKIPLKRTALLYGPYGCITGDAILTVNRGGGTKDITLEQLVYKFNGGKSRHPTKIRDYAWDTSIPTYTQCEYADGTIRLGRVSKAWFSGEKQVYRVTTDGGRSIKATDEHPFLTERGWLRLDALQIGDQVHVRGKQSANGRGPKRIDASRSVGLFYPHRDSNAKSGYIHVYEHRLIYDAHHNGVSVEELIAATHDAESAGKFTFTPPSIVIHHIDEDPCNNDPDNLVAMPQDVHARIHSQVNSRNVLYRAETEAVASIEKLGVEPTYDIEMDGDSPHNFLANGFVVHNTGKTFTSSVTAKLGINHDWTFVTVDNARGLAGALEFARRYQPAIVFAEDIDRVMSQRDEPANDLLNVIDGILGKGNVEVITVLTTNHIEKIEPAMLRPGRIDMIVPIDMPDAEAAARMIRVYGRDLVAETVDLTEVGKVMDGFIPAAIREAIERAKMHMVMDNRTYLSEGDLLAAALSMKAHADLSKPRGETVSDAEAFGIAAQKLLGMNGHGKLIEEIHEATTS